MTALVVRQGTVWPKDAPTKTAILQSALPDSITIQWEVNNTYQAQFTAWDDGSEAFSMLNVQNSVLINGDWFVIKQLQPDYTGGVNTVEVTCNHLYLDWASRNFSYYGNTMKWTMNGQVYNPNASEGLTKAEVEAKGDTDDDSATDNADITQSLDPKGVIDHFISPQANITFSYHGDFSQQNIVVNQDLSFTDVLSLITSTWTTAVIFPKGLDIGIYTSDAFYQNHGTRVDYLHDTPQMQLAYDTTSITNGARLISPTATEDVTTTTSTTETVNTGSQANEVIAFAEKQVGYPYVWGGPRGVDYIGGTDCSGLVSNIYKHFGITIGLTTYTQCNDGTRISRSEVQTGDLGFYNPGPHHVVMALDNSRAIQQPQPGQKCNIFNINSYEPDYWIRNSQMAALVGTPTTSTENETENNTTSISYSYFTPFWYQNQTSVDRWGLFATSDMTLSTAQTVDDAKKEADSNFNLNPTFSLIATFESGEKIVPGDVAHITIKSIGYSTDLNLVGYQIYPYSKTQQPTGTYNSNPTNILDYQSTINNRLDGSVKSLTSQLKATAVNREWITRKAEERRDDGGEENVT